MQLKSAIRDIAPERLIENSPGVEITGATHDSRCVKPGYLFFAVAGFKQDAKQFIADAIERGAVAVVCEKLPQQVDPTINYVQVANVRSVIGPVTRLIYSEPDSTQKIVAITGTNGKTSVAYLLSNLLRAAGKTTTTIGTLGVDDGISIRNTGNTTPEATTLLSELRRVADQGSTHTVMEVSSHALDLHRVTGIKFDALVFTNLSEEHLDFHGTMEDYYRSKKQLFTEHNQTPAVIDIDTEYGARLATELKKADPQRTIITTSVQSAATNKKNSNGTVDDAEMPIADIVASEIKTDLNGSKFTVNNNLTGVVHSVSTKWLGVHNINNSLLALTVSELLDIPSDDAIGALAVAEIVPGRTKPVENSSGLHIFIDYAHTPDAIVTAVNSLKTLSTKPLTLVFGVPGDRGVAGWQRLAHTAAKTADHIILTEDDMKESTLEECFSVAGQQLTEDGANWQLIPNRWDAIAAATSRAQQRGDTVLITGIGHQNTLILADGAGTITIDEQAAVKLAIAGGNPRELDPRNSDIDEPSRKTSKLSTVTGNTHKNKD